MRFLADGPKIPDSLIEQRDEGRVVFLCGAGVSLNSNMPTFLGLTDFVIKKLDPPKDSEILRSFQPWKSKSKSPKTPLDQIFQLLQNEYGIERVNSYVTDRLAQPENRTNIAKEHKIISTISANRSGVPQVVTTNFDRLFELSKKETITNVISQNNSSIQQKQFSISGINYLHGRLADRSSSSQDYILSSADFGRAYLSEGWATNFIKTLLDSYTVVLVGYQAEDPPVKYLLQGLNHDNKSDRSNLFAFDRGSQTEIEAKWRDRGVTSISYSGKNNNHSSLWKTLEQWAERAANPKAWKQKIADIAVYNPRELKPHERGMVSHLVRTTSGAQLFSRNESTPHPEWLCVFDASCRSTKPEKGYRENEKEIDPLILYGLDDDPPRSTQETKAPRYDDILRWRTGDQTPYEQHSLPGRHTEGFEPLPQRLSALIGWVVKVCEMPATLWWAARYRSLHPKLINAIEHRLKTDNTIPTKACSLWSVILEAAHDQRSYSHDPDWFNLINTIKSEGWTTKVIREFEKTADPHYKISSPFGTSRAAPPLDDNADIPTYTTLNASVVFPKRHKSKIDIPPNILPRICNILSRKFEKAADMHAEIGETYSHTPTCYPNRETEGDEYQNSDFDCFKWFLKLLDQLSKEHPEYANALTRTWPKSEPVYFDRLRLYILNKPEVFSGQEAASMILQLPQSAFWNIDLRRELLFLLEDRWTHYGYSQRTKILSRILKGPDKLEHWSDEEYPTKSLELIARYVTWLEKNGCSIPIKSKKRIQNTLKRLDSWNKDISSRFTILSTPRGGIIKTDTSFESISKLLPSKIISTSEESSGQEFFNLVEKKPFIGLVQNDARKALRVLTFEAQKSRFPAKYWGYLIKEWPEKASTRLTIAMCRALLLLPCTTIYETRYAIGRWIENRFPAIHQIEKELSLQIFDHLVTGLVFKGSQATKSSITSSNYGNQPESRRTVDYAINGPIGEATEGLLKVINSLKISKNGKIPSTYKRLILKLLRSPGEGRDHAICVLTQNIYWLYTIDPKWTNSSLFSLFDLNHEDAEPAWNGILSGNLPTDPVWRKIKPHFLNIFPLIYQWNWDTSTNDAAHHWLTWTNIFSSKTHLGTTNKQARKCLRELSEEGRRTVIHLLTRVGSNKENSDGWNRLVIPFIEEVWPKERKFVTQSSVSAWISLIEDSDENFPQVLDAVRQHLVPISFEQIWLHRFSKAMGEASTLSAAFPESVLELFNLVVPNNPKQLPHDMREILKEIEDSEPSLTLDQRFIQLEALIHRRY